MKNKELYSLISVWLVATTNVNIVAYIYLLSLMEVLVHFRMTTSQNSLSDPCPTIFYPFHLITQFNNDSLPNSCLVDLIDVTMAVEDVNSKLDQVVIVADLDAANHINGSLALLQIWKLQFNWP